MKYENFKRSYLNFLAPRHLNLKPIHSSKSTHSSKGRRRMRVIGSLQGYAAFREAIEEYLPERGIAQQDLISLVSGRYNFQSFPQIPPGVQPPQVLVFTSGKFPDADPPFAITQIAMTQFGDVVVAVTTEQAELVLNDLVRSLDTNLGFRLGTAEKKKSLLSNLVAEFDDGLERHMNKIGKMISAINDIRIGLPPFNIKRLAFGIGDVSQTNDPILLVEGADFLIERRQGSQYDRNRYFCSAPMSTTDHVRVLEQIEAIARG